MTSKHIFRFVIAGFYARIHSLKVRLKTVFAFGYLSVSLYFYYIGSQERFSIALCDSYVFLVMQSRRVKVRGRGERNISEPVVVGTGYLNN